MVIEENKIYFCFRNRRLTETFRVSETRNEMSGNSMQRRAKGTRFYEKLDECDENKYCMPGRNNFL